VAKIPETLETRVTRAIQGTLEIKAIREILAAPELECHIALFFYHLI
jgi:hypothetical protein